VSLLKSLEEYLRSKETSELSPTPQPAQPVRQQYTAQLPTHQESNLIDISLPFRQTQEVTHYSQQSILPQSHYNPFPTQSHQRTQSGSNAYQPMPMNQIANQMTMDPHLRSQSMQPFGYSSQHGSQPQSSFNQQHGSQPQTNFNQQGSQPQTNYSQQHSRNVSGEQQRPPAMQQYHSSPQPFSDHGASQFNASAPFNTTQQSTPHSRANTGQYYSPNYNTSASPFGNNVQTNSPFGTDTSSFSNTQFGAHNQTGQFDNMQAQFGVNPLSNLSPLPSNQPMQQTFNGQLYPQQQNGQQQMSMQHQSHQHPNQHPNQQRGNPFSF